MVTIRLRRPFGVLKTSTPPAEWMESLPKDTEWLVVFGKGEELTILEKVEVNGETQYVERIAYPEALLRIFGRLANLAKSFTEG